MRLAKRLSSIFTKKEGSEIAVLTGSIDKEIDKVINQMSIMQVQTVLSSSTGEWLNLWGDKFGIGRRIKESDESYRKRILESVTNLKGTIPALKAAVRRALGEDTDILVRETYNDLRIFNVSTFSGVGKFQDSDTVRLGVVILQINKHPNDRLREEIYKSKAMGTKVIIETVIEMVDGSEVLYDGHEIANDSNDIDDAVSVSALMSKILDIEIYNGND